MTTIRTAMVLAAGRGERMRPFTDSMPKPLAPVAGKPLIAHTIARLAEAGVEQVVINLAWRGSQIREALGDGRTFGVRIAYSDEGDHVLETGGGIVNALPLLGDRPFWVVSGDIWTDYPFVNNVDKLAATDLAHLVMVPNPAFHPRGDFYLRENRLRRDDPDRENSNNPAVRLTYASIGLFSPELFTNRVVAKASMVPWLLEAMTDRRVSGELFEGDWWNVGTLAQLEQLNSHAIELLRKDPTN